jgi:hypothetical protein
LELIFVIWHNKVRFYLTFVKDYNCTFLSGIDRCYDHISLQIIRRPLYLYNGSTLPTKYQYAYWITLSLPILYLACRRDLRDWPVPPSAPSGSGRLNSHRQMAGGQGRSYRPNRLESLLA